MYKINIAEQFSLLDEKWAPKTIAELNGQLVKIIKGSGELVWHVHEDEDKLLIVVKGKLILQLRDQATERRIELNPGEMCVVSKGVEHCPLAEPDTHFIMIEPDATFAS